MKPFVYDIPVKVYFGEHQLGHLGTEVASFGKKVLLTYGGGSIKKSGLYDQIQKELAKAGVKVFELGGIEPNPKIDSVREGARICKEEKIDVLLAVGGGSTIDATKFIAAGAKVDHDPWEFFSHNLPIKQALPIITVLTLAATGSEMDNGGVISNPTTCDKIGRGAKVLLPKVSFLDPSLTYTVSSYQTACGAADILSHLFEVYFNLEKDLYMLDTVMEGLMKTVIRFAPIAMKEPTNYEARANLMWASSWAINGFVNGGKSLAWSCHPMEHELSAYYDITHGLGLAIVTPRWMNYTLNETTAYRYARFGRTVFEITDQGTDLEIGQKAIEQLEKFFFETLGLSRTLTEIGIDDTYFAIMAEKVAKEEGLPGFLTLQKEDIEKIYRLCL